jgi:prefoldin subunit 5
MKTAIARIEAAAAALPGIQAEIDRIQAAIRVLEARAKSLDEADECMRQMERPEAFLDAFAERGILLLERGEDPCRIWDRFRFEDLHEWPEERNEATLQARLPDFRKTLTEGAREYQERIHALNPEEEGVARDLRTLLTTSLALAQRVEPRQAEVEVF